MYQMIHKTAKKSTQDRRKIFHVKENVTQIPIIYPITVNYLSIHKIINIQNNVLKNIF